MNGSTMAVGIGRRRICAMADCKNGKKKDARAVASQNRNKRKKKVV